MLSIIISSYQPNFYSALEKNIAETIGIPYEIIKIDNAGKMGICKAYNIGASQSQFDFLLFLHEDVKFITKNWGEELMKNINLRPNFKIMGIAGNNYIPHTPAPWWCIQETSNSNIIHTCKKTENSVRYSFGENFLPAKYIDGVFIFCTKKNWLENKFDERNEGFHAYDVKFSFDSYQKDTVLLINNVLLEHYSLGNLDQNWMNSLIEFWTYKNPEKYNYNFELTAYKFFADQLRHLKYPKKKTLKLLIHYYSIKRFGIKNSMYAIKKIFDILRF